MGWQPPFPAPCLGRHSLLQLYTWHLLEGEYSSSFKEHSLLVAHTPRGTIDWYLRQLWPGSALLCVFVCVFVRATTINPAIENFPLFISLFFWAYFRQHWKPLSISGLGIGIWITICITIGQLQLSYLLLLIVLSSTFPSWPASLSLCHPLQPRGHPRRWLNKKYTRMFTLIHSLQVKFLVQLLILFLAGDFIACLPARLALPACKCFAAALARLCSCFMPHRFF